MTDKLTLYKKDGSNWIVYPWDEDKILLESIVNDRFKNNKDQFSLSFVDYNDRHFVNWVCLNYNSLKLYAVDKMLPMGDYKLIVDQKYSWLDIDKSS